MGRQVAPDARLRVALVCGPEVMRLGVERLLAQEDGAAVRAYRRLRAAREPADVAVVCDRDLADAPRVCAAAAAGLGAGVVLVTGRPDPLAVLDCLAAGATGLLAEDDSADDLPAAVRAAARGEYHVGPRLLTVLLDWERARRRRPPSTQEAERRLLALLAGGRTTAEIAAALGVTSKTVRNRSSLLYRRLGVRSRAQAVRIAEARGLLDEPAG